MRAEKFGISASKEVIEDKKKMRALKFGLDLKSKNITKGDSIRSVINTNNDKKRQRLERFKGTSNKKWWCILIILSWLLTSNINSNCFSISSVCSCSRILLLIINLKQLSINHLVSFLTLWEMFNLKDLMEDSFIMPSSKLDLNNNNMRWCHILNILLDLTSITLSSNSKHHLLYLQDLFNLRTTQYWTLTCIRYY